MWAKLGWLCFNNNLKQNIAHHRQSFEKLELKNKSILHKIKCCMVSSMNSWEFLGVAHEDQTHFVSIVPLTDVEREGVGNGFARVFSMDNFDLAFRLQRSRQTENLYKEQLPREKLVHVLSCTSTYYTACRKCSFFVSDLPWSERQTELWFHISSSC